MTIAIDTTPSGDGCNSYVTEAEAETYMEGRLYKDEWSAASADVKRAALVQATVMIDMLDFVGSKANLQQPRAWPRTSVKLIDTDTDYYLGLTEYPVELKNAQCEMALALLKGDRTDDGGVQPLNALSIGSLSLSFRQAGQRTIPNIARSMLAQYTRSSMNAKLVRV